MAFYLRPGEELEEEKEEYVQKRETPAFPWVTGRERFRQTPASRPIHFPTHSGADAAMLVRELLDHGIDARVVGHSAEIRAKDASKAGRVIAKMTTLPLDGLGVGLTNQGASGLIVLGILGLSIWGAYKSWTAAAAPATQESAPAPAPLPPPKTREESRERRGLPT